jgi:hypothetical protein
MQSALTTSPLALAHAAPIHPARRQMAYRFGITTKSHLMPGNSCLSENLSALAMRITFSKLMFRSPGSMLLMSSPVQSGLVNKGFSGGPLREPNVLDSSSQNVQGQAAPRERMVG